MSDNAQRPSTDLVPELQEAISRQLEPREFMRALGLASDEIRVVGPMLKCMCAPFCGLAREQKFPTVLVDGTKRTYQCTVPTCPLFKGGPLIELHTRQAKSEALGPLLALARKLKISFDEDLTKRLAGEMQAVAQNLYREGDFAGARFALVRALEGDPRNLDLLRLAGKLEEKSGRPNDAVEAYLRGVKVAIAARDLDVALRFLRDDALRLNPTSHQLMTAVAETLDRMGRHDEGFAERLRAADLLEEADKLPEALELLDTLFSQRQTADLSHRIAMLALNLGDSERALAQFEDAMGRHRGAGDAVREREAMTQFVQLAPARWPERMRLAAIISEEDVPAGCREWIAIARLALERRDPTIADEASRRALELRPEEVSAIETRGEVLVRLRRREEAAKHLLRAAELYREMEFDSEVERLLLLAKEAAPDDVDVSIATARHAMREGGDYAPAMESAVRSLARLGRVDEAVELLRMSVDSNPGVMPRADAGATLLAEVGYASRGAELYAVFADQVLSSDPRKAMTAAQRGLELAPGDPVLQRLVFDSNLAAGNLEFAVEAARGIAGGSPASLKRAEDSLRALLEHRPHDVRILELLSTILTGQNRRGEAARVLADCLDRIPTQDRSERRRVAMLLEDSGEPLDDGMKRLLIRVRSESTDGSEAESALLALSDAEIGASRWSEAIEFLERAVALPACRPSTLRLAADAQLSRGDMYRAQDLYDLYLHRMIELGDPAQIAEAHRHVFTKDPGRRDVLLKLSRIQAASGAREASRDTLREVEKAARAAGDERILREVLAAQIESATDDHAARERLGTMLLGLGDHARGAAELFRAAEGYLSEGDPAGSVRCAKALLAQQSSDHRRAALERIPPWHEAAGDLQSAADAWAELAEARRNADDYQGAVGALDEALRLRAGKFEWMKNRAEYLDKSDAPKDKSLDAWLKVAALAHGVDLVAALRKARALAPDRPEIGSQIVEALRDSDPAESKREALALSDWHEWRKEPETALAIVAALLPRNPGNAEIILRIARLSPIDDAVALLAKSAQEARAAGELAKAKGFATVAAEKDPSSADAVRALAEVLEDEGDKRGAARQFDALAWLTDSDAEKAQALDRAVSLDNSDRPRRRELARILLSGVDIPRGVELSVALAEAFLVDNSYPDALVLAGDALAHAPDDHRLLEATARSLEGAGDKPRAAMAWMEAARAHSGRGVVESALACMEKATAAAPTSIDARTALVAAFDAIGNVDRADLEALEHARLLKASGRVPEALALLERRRASLPESKVLLEGLVTLLGEEGRGSEGAKLLITRATSQAGYRNLAGARASLERALELDPGNRAAGLQHAELLLRLGEADPAFIRVTMLLASTPNPADRVAAHAALIASDLADASAETRAPRLISALIAGGMREEALEAFVRLSAKSHDRSLRLTASETLGALFGDDPEALGVVLSAARDARDGVRAEALACRISALHEAAGAHSDAREVLDACIRMDQDRLGLHHALIALLERTNAARPVLAEAIADLEASAARLGDRGAARDAGRRLLALTPEDTGAAERLADMCIEDGATNEAIDILTSVARGHAARGSVHLALDLAARAASLDPDSDGPRRFRLELARSSGDSAEIVAAASDLAETVARTGGYSEELALRREVFAALPDDLEAALATQRAAEHAGDEQALIESLLSVARLAQGTGNAEVSQNAMARLGSLAPEDRQVLRQMGEFLLAGGDREGAVRTLIIAAEKFQTHGENDTALALCDRLVESTPQNAPLRTMRASVLESLGRREDAADELAVLAELRMAEGRADDAAEAVRKLLELSPLRAMDRSRLAEMLQRAGDREGARVELETAAADLQKAGKLSAALDAANRALLIAPEGATIHQLLAELHEARNSAESAATEHRWLAKYYEDRRSYDNAARHVDALRRLGGDTPETIFKLAELLKKKGAGKEAGELLSKLAEDAEKSGDRDTSIRALEACSTANPTDFASRRKLAGLLEESGQNPKAIEAWTDIVRGEIDAGLIDDALAHAKTLLERHGHEPSVRRRIGDAYVSCSIPELAVAEYAEAGRLLVERGDATAGLEAARLARDLRPADPAPRRVEIDALLILGRKDSAYQALIELAHYYAERDKGEQAIGLYREAIALHPNETKPRHHLATMLEQAGRPEEFVTELRALADLYASNQQDEQTVIVLKRLINVRPDDTRARVQYIDAYCRIGSESDLVDDYVRLAEIHVRRGAMHEAERVYERLLTLSTGRTDLREKFIEFLHKHGAPGRAVQESFGLAGEYISRSLFRDAQSVLQRIEDAAGDAPEYFLLRGRIHEGTNARGTSLRDLRKAAALFKTRGDQERWRETLRQILRVDPYDVEAPEELIRHLEGTGNQEEAMQVILQLAESYESRKLYDFAEGEYRRALRMKPDADDIWMRLIGVRARYATPQEMASEFLGFGDALLARGRVQEAIGQFSEAVQADPLNVDARLRYVKTYLKMGRDKDIADDIISLGDLLSAAGRVEEALEWYGRLVASDPTNTGVREKMSATQARRMQQASATQTSPGTLKHRPPSNLRKPPIDTDIDISQTQSRMLDPGSDAQDATGFLSSALSRIEEEEDQAAITQVINNYRDILSVNANNGAVRVKLADVLEQVGDHEGATRELLSASEIFFAKGDLNQCVSVCERLMAKDPRNQKVRDRLLKAINKRDAFKAIESAILFSDGPDVDTESKF